MRDMEIKARRRREFQDTTDSKHNYPIANVFIGALYLSFLKLFYIFITKVLSCNFKVFCC